jgi:hypothetical protein
LGGAFAIEGLEELALGVVALQLRVCGRRKKTEKCGGQQKFRISAGRGKEISRRGEEKL